MEHLKTDVFREQVDYSERVKAKLTDARRSLWESRRRTGLWRKNWATSPISTPALPLT